MADPYRDLFLIQIPGKGKDIFIGMTGELFMLFTVDMLDIQKDQIGNFQEPADLFHGLRAVRGKCDAGGVEAGMDAFRLCHGKQFGNKGCLHQRLAAADGDAAVFIEIPGGCKLGQDLAGSHPGSAFRIPGVWIMAVKAAHGTAF